ncbi:hypothetical protein [Bacillus sp. T33-2]|uniref:hypothetical protein n=1 Tax=Bacillus sp. T33-2 TaxID=2054168 RepID=UPI000C7594D9|nr:hypothetical protein [Bacillus sp. T33-2]PLR98185.1 hypothetical protein CVD19_06215 [Bacillus sp. T33-2]
MNWKTFLLGFGAGLLGAYAVKELSARSETVSSEEVLKHVKAVFKKEGPISGSWINMNIEPHIKHPIEYQVYRGGISRNIDGVYEQFEFIADAKTGTILDTYPLT